MASGSLVIGGSGQAWAAIMTGRTSPFHPGFPQGENCSSWQRPQPSCPHLGGGPAQCPAGPCVVTWLWPSSHSHCGERDRAPWLEVSMPVHFPANLCEVQAQFLTGHIWVLQNYCHLVILQQHKDLAAGFTSQAEHSSGRCPLPTACRDWAHTSTMAFVTTCACYLTHLSSSVGCALRGGSGGVGSFSLPSSWH